MSNISRRDFLKTAGVMTLAVAAAGVLAGCDNKPNNDDPIPVASNSVVVGAYTVSIAKTAMANIKSVGKDTATDYQKRLYIMINVKRSGTDYAAPAYFSLSEEKENLGNSQYYAGLTKAEMKKFFGTTLIEAYDETTVNSLLEKGYPAIPSEGFNYWIAFNVNDKTPAWTLVVTPTDDAKDAVKLVADIPAAVEVNAADLED